MWLLTIDRGVILIVVPLYIPNPIRSIVMILIPSTGILYRREIISLSSTIGTSIRVTYIPHSTTIQSISQLLQEDMVRNKLVAVSHIIPMVSNMIILGFREIPNIIDSLRIISAKIPSITILITIRSNGRKIGLLSILPWKIKCTLLLALFFSSSFLRLGFYSQ